MKVLHIAALLFIFTGAAACSSGTLEIVSSSSQEVQMPEDMISPTEIEHRVDEILADGELIAYYNFIVYHFETDEGYIWARSYLDEIEIAGIHGPFVERGLIDEVEAPEFYQNVMHYLQRRYFKIIALGKDGYDLVWVAPGYQE